MNEIEGILHTLNLGSRRDWVIHVEVARDRFAQRVPLAGGPMRPLTVRNGRAEL